MVTDGECQTCRGLSTKEERTAGITDEIPDSVDFPTLDINSNSQYIIVHGKRLLGSNEIIVIKRGSGDILERYGVGWIARLTGGVYEPAQITILVPR